jgi:hypothetical protein
VGQLYARALGSLFVASYDSQGYGEDIRTRLRALNWSEYYAVINKGIPGFLKLKFVSKFYESSSWKTDCPPSKDSYQQSSLQPVHLTSGEMSEYYLN